MYTITKKRCIHVLLILKKRLIAYGKKLYSINSNNINGNFLELLKNIYKQRKCAIKINHKLTKFFNHEKGVRQGDPLSSTLFNIYINDLFNEIGKVNIDLVTLNDIDNINALMFADDLILISTSKTGLQNSLNVLEIT